MLMNYAEDDSFATLGSSPAPEPDGTRQRQRILNLLRGRWKWVVVLSAILGPGLAVAGFLAKKGEYISAGTILMNQYLPQVTEATAPGGKTTDEFLRVEMALIKSPRVVELVTKDEGWRRIADADLTDDLNAITKGIYIENEPRTNLLNIGFIHEKPEVAEAGARAVMAAHKKAFADKYENFDAKVLRTLRETQTRKQRELINLRTQRDNLTKDVGAENLDGPYTETNKQKLEVERALHDVKMALIALGADVGQAESPLAGMTEDQLGEIDAVMADLLLRKRNLEMEIARLKNQGIGENHRQMIVYRRDLQTIDEQIALHGNQLRTGAVALRSRGMNPSMTENATVEQLKKKEAQLTLDLEQLKASLISIGRTNISLKSLNTDIQVLDAELRDLDKRIEGLSMEAIGEHIEVIRGATPAMPYEFSKRLRLAVLGGMFGVGCALGLVLLWGVIDSRFRHIDDVELDMPRVLGSLPTLADKFESHEQGVLVAHSVHHIRTLLQIGREDRSNVFSVTSPSAGSGKTSLTMALGLSFASAGSRTLLIDCDVVGGGLTRRMNASAHSRVGQILLRMRKIDQHAIDEALKAQQVSGKRVGEALIGLGYITRADLDAALKEQKRTSVGLLEVCQGEEFNACICRTGIDRLDVLPIGTALPQQAGVLSPNAIKRLITSARAAYDTVLLDTGPILGSIEASMAAAEADGSILIIARGDKKGLVDKCVEHFRRINGNLIGVVFNHALADDIARSNYGSVTASQSRHPNQQSLIDTLDADTSARYGPLATAVASYGARGGLRKSNGQGNGHSNGNGH